MYGLVVLAAKCRANYLRDSLKLKNNSTRHQHSAKQLTSKCDLTPIGMHLELQMHITAATHYTQVQQANNNHSPKWHLHNPQAEAAVRKAACDRNGMHLELQMQTALLSIPKSTRKLTTTTTITLQNGFCIICKQKLPSKRLHVTEKSKHHIDTR